MRQVIKHRDIRLLNMIRRTDPVIPLDLAKFLNQIGPRYGYEFLAIEDYYILNDYLGLMEIEGNPTPCYLAPLGKELAEQLED